MESLFTVTASYLFSNMPLCLRCCLAVRPLPFVASITHRSSHYINQYTSHRIIRILNVQNRSIGTPASLNVTAAIQSKSITPLRNEPLHVLRLDHDRQTDIHQQLRIEESLLRCSTKNYLIINRLPIDSKPTVVIGISGYPERWCNLIDVM
jgi:hypothetical protein